MKNDIAYMKKDLGRLKKEILELMIIKFGRKVDIDEIEEAHLRKLVLELRMSKTDIRSLYEHELHMWKVRINFSLKLIGSISYFSIIFFIFS